MQAAVKDGVNAVGLQLASVLAVLIDQVGACAVLHAEIPRGREVAPDAVFERGCGLVAQVFHGIVRLEIGLVVAAVLMDIGIAQGEAAQWLARAPLAVEVER